MILWRIAFAKFNRHYKAKKQQVHIYLLNGNSILTEWNGDCDLGSCYTGSLFLSVFSAFMSICSFWSHILIPFIVVFSSTHTRLEMEMRNKKWFKVLPFIVLADLMAQYFVYLWREKYRFRPPKSKFAHWAHICAWIFISEDARNHHRRVCMCNPIW